MINKSLTKAEISQYIFGRRSHFLTDERLKKIDVLLKENIMLNKIAIELENELVEKLEVKI